VLHAIAAGAAAGAAASFDYYADLAGTFAWEEPAKPDPASSRRPMTEAETGHSAQRHRRR
jgi:hypothetical protein